MDSFDVREHFVHEEQLFTVASVERRMSGLACRQA
jgi:hypothetical protein